MTAASYESTGPRGVTRTTAAERRAWGDRATRLSMLELLQAVHQWRARAMRVRTGAGALWLELRDLDGSWHRVGPEQRRALD